jgi:hypothetical protein
LPRIYARANVVHVSRAAAGQGSGTLFALAHAVEKAVDSPAVFHSAIEGPNLSPQADFYNESMKTLFNARASQARPTPHLSNCSSGTASREIVLSLLLALQLTSFVPARANEACVYVGFVCPDQLDPPPCDPSGSGDGSTSSACASCNRSSPAGVGMPSYWVSEPYINLRIEDSPLLYRPARGSEVTFHLS